MMAGSAAEDDGACRSSEGLSNGQWYQSADSLAEWRSSEQVENGTPSTSPPYWDTDDDDDDCGPKPPELYGKFTWKIENFFQISKRELRSNAFEVGGYKWYILIYPQGCDVCNHLSLFLCVANHDKLLPGWSHFAQFTIAVVNKDPKKSKYSDTLHRFWKKEHDWGWKKFMELSKVSDGFIVSDTLVIKAQVQVIREKAHRPFRCLDCQYRRELVRVYLSNVESNCRRFCEERRNKLKNLIEDKMWWSSFHVFWLGVDQSARRRMSREKMDDILKVVVKQFFIEKEVTSTLVMDSLYSGLKALECQSKNKKGRVKLGELEEMPAPIVRIEKDMFVLADDVLVLLERATLESLPPKDDKGPQNRTKDGTSGEDFNRDSIERDERRLTELGRRTIEIFVLAHIFSQIEVAYQEAVALKRQEELIREEEAAGLAESEPKGKRGAVEKEKRTKKKQAKQRRSGRKGKDRGREEKSDSVVQEKHQGERPSAKKILVDLPAKQGQSILDKDDTLEDISNVSDTGDDISETLQHDLEERDAIPTNWDRDTSEVHPSTEASSSGMNCLPIQSGGMEKKSPSVMDDSSSTCSTGSVPSVVMNGPYKGYSMPNYKGPSLGRREKQRNKDPHEEDSGGHATENLQLDTASDAGPVRDASSRCGGNEPESEASLLSLKDRIQWLEQNLVEKGKEVASLQKKLSVKDQVDVDESPKQRTAEASASSGTPMRKSPSKAQPKQDVEMVTVVESRSVRQASLNSLSQSEKAVPLVTRSPQIPPIFRPDTQKAAPLPKATCAPIEKSATQQVSIMSRPSSAPLIPAPRPNVPVVSVVQTAPLLSRSVSAAGRLGADPSPATQMYAPQTYRNVIAGRSAVAISASFAARPTSRSLSPALSYSQPPTALASVSMLSPQGSSKKEETRTGFNFGNVGRGIVQNQPQWIQCSQQESSSGMVCGPSLLDGIQSLDMQSSGGSGSQTYYTNEVRAGALPRQSQGISADEFPHLDIINDLLDEEHGTGKVDSAFHSPNNGYRYPLNRQFTFPGDVGMSEMGNSISCCRFDRSARYLDDGIDRIYSSSSRPYNGLREVAPQVSLSGYMNGHVDGIIQNQWAVDGSDLCSLGMRNMEADGYPYRLPDYSNLPCGVNGFPAFRPTNGH